MSTTYFTPSPGSSAADSRSLGGKLAVWVEIRELEQKSKGAEGKVHAHYQERLKELCNTLKTLEGELAGLGTEQIPRTLTPSIPLPQDLLRPEAAAVPAELKT